MSVAKDSRALTARRGTTCLTPSLWFQKKEVKERGGMKRDKL